MLFFSLGLLGSWLSPAARAESPACEQATSLIELIEAHDAALKALEAFDQEALLLARDQALEKVPCLTDRIRTEESASFHRMMGLVAFVEQDEAMTLGEFRAARRLDPGDDSVTAYFSEGHPLVEIYDRSAERSEELEQLRVPAGLYLRVDGVRDGLRPEGVGVLVQVFNQSDHLLDTLYLDAEVDATGWLELTEDRSWAVGADWSSEPAARLSVAQGLVSGGLVLLGGGALVYSQRQVNQLKSDVLSQAETSSESAYQRAQQLNMITVIGLGTLSAGGLVGIWWWLPSTETSSGAALSLQGRF